MESNDVTLSQFLRQSGEVLTWLEGQDVVLRRRDGEDVELTTSTRSRSRREGLGLLARTVQEALRGPGPTLLERALADAAPWTRALTSTERAQLLLDVAEASASEAELGSPEQLGRVLDRWKRAALGRWTGRPRPTYMTRPVAIPDDVDDPSNEKASGVVELPLRVRWSAPSRSYDLNDPGQLRRVYEQVLREGTEDDIRRFVEVDRLVEHWNELVLPRPVRVAWAEWLKRRRGLDLAC